MMDYSECLAVRLPVSFGLEQFRFCGSSSEAKRGSRLGPSVGFQKLVLLGGGPDSVICIFGS